MILSDVTCLGCGCACDDIRITVRDGRIVEAARACDLGAAWFGDGSLPAEAAIDAVRATMDEALASAAALVRAARFAQVVGQPRRVDPRPPARHPRGRSRTHVVLTRGVASGAAADSRVAFATAVWPSGVIAYSRRRGRFASAGICGSSHALVISPICSSRPRAR